MNIHIDKPVLNKPTTEENMIVVDRWIADTAKKLNLFIEATNRKLEGEKK